MDPISASTYNLRAIDSEDLNIPPGLAASCKSLSTIEKKNFRNLLPQILAAIIGSSNHITIGMGLAYSAVLIPQLEAEDSDIPVTKTETSWIASVVALIGPVGAIMSAYMMDRWGRINSLKLSVLPAILGWVLIAASPNIATLIIGRTIAGLSSLLGTSPAIVYVTEIARKDMRGSLLSLGPAYVSLGMVIAYLKGWLLHWRTIAWLCNIYIIISFLLIFIIPESPIWLVSKGRLDEAKKALTWLHKYQPQPPNDERSFAELQLSVLVKEDEQKKFEAKMSGGNAFKEFLKPTGYKPMLILSALFFFQQFSGIYIFLFYSVNFFKEVGTTFNPFITSIWIGVIRLVMSLCNTVLLKRYTRRLLIMVSASGMAISTFISGLFTYWLQNGTTEYQLVPVMFLLIYVVASMMGLLTIPWTMTAELFPLKIRSLAHSIATSIVNILMFLAVQNYENLKHAFGGSAGVQWFFSGISVGAVIFTLVFLPETHRKKLSEIQEYFMNNTIYLGQKKKPGQNRRISLVDDKDNQNSPSSDKLINSA